RKNILFPLENMNVRKNAIEKAYREAHLIETPKEAQLYYSYLEKSESLKNKFRRSESEAKAQFKSAELALDKEFLDKKKENFEDLSSLKVKLNEQKEQLKTALIELEKQIQDKKKTNSSDLSKLQEKLNEQREQYKNALVKFKKEIQDKKKANTDHLSSLKGRLEEQRAQFKLDLEEKIKGFDQAYIEELSKITPPNLKELKITIENTYLSIEKEALQKLQKIKADLKAMNFDQVAYDAALQLEIEKHMPKSVALVVAAKAVNYRKQMNDDAVEMAKLVGIEDQLDKTPAQLSGG